MKSIWCPNKFQSCKPGQWPVVTNHLFLPQHRHHRRSACVEGLWEEQHRVGRSSSSSILSPFLPPHYVTLMKHRKNCECCHHHSVFKGHNAIVHIVVLNCQKCNQCLKCQVSGHKVGLLHTWLYNYLIYLVRFSSSFQSTWGAPWSYKGKPLCTKGDVLPIILHTQWPDKC